MKQQPVHRHAGERHDGHDAVADLHDVVTPRPLGLDPHWGLQRGSGARCERCRRVLKTGEPVLQGCADGVFCGLCGRHRWARQWEGETE